MIGYIYKYVCSGKRKSAGKFQGHPIKWEKL